MDFTDDELRLLLDALSSLANAGKLDAEDSQTFEEVRTKIRQRFNPTPDK